MNGLVVKTLYRGTLAVVPFAKQADGCVVELDGQNRFSHWRPVGLKLKAAIQLRDKLTEIIRANGGE